MPRDAQRQENWQAARGALTEAANTAGIDPGVLIRIAGFESGFDHDARPIARNQRANRVQQFDGVMAISSAHGYGQFVDGTWVAMLRKYGEKYGVDGASGLTKEQANAPGLRRDPQLQAAMLAEFTRENIQRGALVGGTDANANVYAFHNLGQRDATRFLRRLEEAPHSRVDSVLSAAVVHGNPGLYGDGSRTISESYAAMGLEMARFDHFVQDIRDGSIQRVARAAQKVESDHLSVGDKGPSVQALQRQLDVLGYRGVDGSRLAIDGNFGRHTAEALQAFQRAHRLEDVGFVGPRTRAALASAREAGPSPVDPAHPDHALHQQLAHAVDAMERSLGRVADVGSHRLVASLLAASRAHGLTRVDHVVLSVASGGVAAGQHVFAVQGRLEDPASARVHLSTQQALATPAEAAFARLAQAASMPPPLGANHDIRTRYPAQGEHGAGLQRVPSP